MQLYLEYDDVYANMKNGLDFKKQVNEIQGYQKYLPLILFFFFFLNRSKINEKIYIMTISKIVVEIIS